MDARALRDFLERVKSGELAVEDAARLLTELPVQQISDFAQLERVYDVGISGLHRLLRRAPALREADALVVCAGMEGALPSVVGGLVARPVIAVPTSVGYGASLGGIAALLAMLNSCAANVT